MPPVATRYVTVDAAGLPPEVLAEATEVLTAGGIVAFPTETVYGLGVLRDSSAAVERLYELKQRPGETPLTLHIADPEAVEVHVGTVSPHARSLMERYWPGPLTLVLPGIESGTVGVRVPSHEVARQLLRQVGRPVVATSANPHGAEPAVDAEGVRRYFDGRIDVVIDGGPSLLRQASTVVRIDGDSWKVLREGIITHEMVHQLLVGRNILFICTGNSCRSPMAAGLFSSLLAEKLGTGVEDLGELGYTIHSAGVFAVSGGTATENAIKVMSERGIDISRHRTRPLTEEMIRSADRIYVLGASHLLQVVQLDSEAGKKTSLLGEETVADPIGGEIETYVECADEIEKSVRKLLENI